MVVDDEISIVGTANMDNRSFRLNFEVVAAIYDEATARELGRVFEHDLAKAELVKVRELRDKGFVERLGESAARLFSPLL
jgi:cardiolipin synthase